MKVIGLAVEDQYADKHEFGVRVTNILSRINFPNREKTIFKVFGRDPIRVVLYVEAVDTKTGSSTQISHNTRWLYPKMSDQEIAAEIFVITSQFVIHEFMENYRFDGKIAFDPHISDGHRLVFTAIQKTAKPDKRETVVVAIPIPRGTKLKIRSLGGFIKDHIPFRKKAA
jgi:hypothetical protein